MFMNNQLITEMPKLHKFAIRLTHNRADSEDLLQSTLLKAIEKKDRFETGSNLFAWTSKIMFNQFLNNCRRKKHDTHYDPQEAINRARVDETQSLHMDCYKVGQAFDTLSPDHKDVVVKICLEGKSYARAAAETGVPVGTVRSRLSRARDILKEAV